MGMVSFGGRGWLKQRCGQRPIRVFTGSLWEDAAILEREVKELQDGRMEKRNAFLAGTIDYKGRFTFGLYHEAGQERILKAVNERPQIIEVEEVTTRNEFTKMVLAAQDYIRAGDVYQVNLSRKFRAKVHAFDPGSFYSRLRKVSPAPYAALLHQEHRTVISASPECFLRLNGRDILTSPIKGTRPRRETRVQDKQEARELLRSNKERAELLMITDLERSDLGQVCEYGSVRVEQFAELRSFAQVHHLVSTVRGRLRTEISHVSALRACFPGGSITGAPKRRARGIIQELEPVERGLYTGAIGWFGADGTSEFSIAIRTVVLELGGELHFHVGAGIVADSVPELEFQETNYKADGILLAASGRIGS